MSSTRRTKHLTQTRVVRLPANLDEAVLASAAEQGVSLSDVIRDGLAAQLGVTLTDPNATAAVEQTVLETAAAPSQVTA